MFRWDRTHQCITWRKNIPRFGKGPNPFIDPEGYKHELDINEHAFLQKLDEQKKAAGV